MDSINDYVMSGDTLSPQSHVLSALLAGYVTELMSAGVSSAKLSAPWDKAWDWCLEYSATYGELPTPARFTEAFSDIYLPNWDGRPVSDIIDQFFLDAKTRYVRQAVLEVGNLLASGRQQLAADRWSEWNSAITGLTTRVVIERYVSDSDERLATYLSDDEEHTGKFVPFGIKPIDDATGGAGPGDYVVIAGRFDTGKTTFMSSIAEFVAGRTGKRALFISPEHTSEAIIRKLDALRARVDPLHIRNRTLTANERTRLINSFKGDCSISSYDGEIHVVAAAKFTPDVIGSLTTHLHPDVVYVDGLEYVTISERGQPDWLTVGLAGKALKQLAVTHNVPVFVVHQASRASEKVGIKDGLARSDMVGRDADIVIGIKSVTDLIIRVSLLKWRESVNRVTVFLQKDSDEFGFKLTDNPSLMVGSVEDFI